MSFLKILHETMINFSKVLKTLQARNEESITKKTLDLN